MTESSRNFRYRNRDGAWLDFQWRGLRLLSDGSLTLAPLPATGGPLDLDSLPAPARLAGVAVSPAGDLFFSNAETNQIFRRPCAGDPLALDIPGLSTPAGLAVSPERGALIAADPAAGQVLVIDWETGALLEIWGGLRSPQDVAVDSAARVYIAEPGAGRVSRYLLTGHRDPSFDIAGLGSPSALAIDGDRLFVLDLDAGSVLEFDLNGHWQRLVAKDLTAPMGLAAFGGEVYGGSNSARRIHVWSRGGDGDYLAVGDAAGYDGPVAALAVGFSGSLWAHPGGTAIPVALTAAGAFTNEGLLWSGPLDAGGQITQWHRLRAWVDVPEEAGIQFFTFMSNDGAAGPPPPDGGVFPAPWKPVPRNVADFFLGTESAYLWIAARFESEGKASPRLTQIRTDFDQRDAYLQYLPRTFALNDTDGRYLERFLALLQSMFEEAEDPIANLPALVDADAIPDNGLPWLASFLGLEFAESMPAAERRKLIAGAFAQYALRGTPDGLRQAILAEAGVHAVIREPLALAGWWQLPARPQACSDAAVWDDPAGTALGLNTFLSAAAPQGAVVGSSAVLDQSHLLYGDEYGMALFADVAHRFQVLVYAGEVACPEKRAAVDAVVEREKPAHTEAETCVIAPLFRIGWQAILGIDTVVGGPAAPARLGSESLVLDGPPAGTIGESARVGMSARL